MTANTASSAVTSDLTTAVDSKGYSREEAFSVFYSSIGSVGLTSPLKH